MFTGIVTDLGRVRATTKRGDTRFVFATAYDTASIAIGASMACNGVCLTVVEKGPDWFAADASTETLSCTTLGAWREGRLVNLERSLRIGDELGGHIVTGHVDGTAILVAADREGDSRRLSFDVAPPLARFIAPKGAVALDGVSLTVNDVSGHRFGVNIIAHTRTHTSLGEIRVGERVNIEIDVLARYVARLGQAEHT
jgi:riboflavin synthase